MTNYILIILSVGICAFILESVLSCFDTYKNISQAVKFIYSLCIFFAIIVPIFSIKPSFLNIQSKNQQIESNRLNFTPSFNTLLKDELENKTKQEILNKSGILIIGISIDLSSEESKDQKTITVESAHITLSKDNQNDTDKIADYLKSTPEFNRAKITFSFSGKNNYEQDY